jgi:hypothetical protein
MPQPAIRPDRGRRGRSQPEHCHRCSDFKATSGAVATIFRSAAAGPVGLQRCCSQFCRVRTLTCIKRANSLWLSPMRSRTRLTSGASTLNRREGRALPLAMAAASLRLVTRSANSFFSISQLLHQATQSHRLGGGQRVLSRLRVGEQHQDSAVLPDPIMDDPDAAALAAPLGCPSQLVDTPNRRGSGRPAQGSPQDRPATPHIHHPTTAQRSNV